MDSEETDDRSTCSCPCLCCGPHSTPSSSFRRSLKRRLDQLHQDYVSYANAITSGVNNGEDNVNARVEIENEAAMLRETLNRHQISIQELYGELEEERSAAATAASEAMSMILRLQREKAEAQMEFRQFKRFAEEKMSHDCEEISQLEDLLFRREQDLQSLSYEVQVYRQRLIGYGFFSGNQTPCDNLTPTTSDSAAFAAAAAFDYPELKCKIVNEFDTAEDLEKYAFGETPKERIMNIEERISQMEKMPGSSHDKGVVAFSSPTASWHQHCRRLSMDSYGLSPYASKVEDKEYEACDRVYTVDSINCAPETESFINTPREVKMGTGKDEVEEIKRLYARLQALEADRETMRQTIMSMGTEKAQIVLLKEIAQQLCKDGRSGSDAEKKIVKRQPSFWKGFSMLTAVKVICVKFVLLFVGRKIYRRLK